MYMEFRNIKGWSINPLDSIFEAIPLVVLCFFTFRNLIKDAKLFRNCKQRISFLPSFTCILFLAIIFSHLYIHAQKAMNKTIFTAHNYQLTDEGFHLEFKENGFVQGLVARRFTEDYYWGKYKKDGDTIYLDMQTNINLGNTAVVKNDTMKMVGDSIYFLIERP